MPVKCQYCKTEILWLWDKATKKPAPIEAYPSLWGNVFVKDMRFRVASEYELKRARELRKPLYLIHSPSCGFAHSFGKKAAAAAAKIEPGPPPACENCGLEMNLIESDTLWFCPFGCSKIEVN